MNKRTRQCAVKRNPVVAQAVRRALLTTALALSSTMAANTYAIGFGKSEVGSALGQPLDLRIPVELEPAEQIDPKSLLSEIPDYWEHSERGVEAVGADGLKSEVVVAPDGQAEIKVTSDEPVAEPVMNFLVRLKWPNGELLREYSFILDFPAASGPAVTASPVEPVIRRSNAAPSGQPLSAGPATVSNEGNGARRFGPVQPGDTLYRVVREFYPALLGRAAEVGNALARANPSAFVNSDPNRMIAGASLVLPPQATLFGSAPVQVVTATAASSSTPAAPASAPSTEGVQEYAVRPGDTLYRIAQAAANGDGTRINALMDAIVAANPQGFVNGDKNRLLSGVTLRIPGSGSNLAAAPPARQAATSQPTSSTQRASASAAATSATPTQVAERDSLQVQIAETRAAIEAEKVRQASLSERLDALEIKIDALQTRTVQQDNTIEQVQQTIARVEATIAQATAPKSVTLVSDAAPKAASTVSAQADSSASATPAAAPVKAAPAKAKATPKPKRQTRVQPPAPETGFDPLAPVSLVSGAALLALLLGGYALYRRRKAAAGSDERDTRASADAARARLAELRDQFAEDSSAFEDPELSHDNVVSINRAMAGKFAEEAVLAFSSNEYDQAEDLIEKAIKVDSDRSEYKELLACIYDATNRELDANILRSEIGGQTGDLGGRSLSG